MRIVVAAGEGRSRGEIFTPCPDRFAVSVAGGSEPQLGKRGFLFRLVVGKELFADAALPVRGGTGGLAGRGNLGHSVQLMPVGGDTLGLGRRVVLALEGDLRGVGTDAGLFAGRRRGHLVRDRCGNRFRMALVAAGEGRSRGVAVAPCPDRFAVGMAVGNRDGHGRGGDVPFLSVLAVPILIELPLGGLFLILGLFQRFLDRLVEINGDRDLGVVCGQLFRGVLDIVRDILSHAVGIVGSDLHALGIEEVADLVGRAVGLLRDLQLCDPAAQAHELRGVVLEVDIALAVCNGAANGVLRLRPTGRKEHIRRFDGVLLAVFAVGLHGGVGVIDLGHTGFVAQHAQLAGREVVEEIDVHIAVLVLIGRGQQAAGLRIALRGDIIGDGKTLKIDHGDIVAGVSLKLTHAGYADIGTALVNYRCGGAHCLIVIHAVFQMQALQGVFDKGAVLIGSDLIEVAALRGEVIGVRLRVIADAAAQVADVRHANLVQKRAGLGIERQDGAVAGMVIRSAVVGRDKDIILAGVGARPVKAVVGIGPGSELFLVRLRRILIRDGDADEVSLFHLLYPEAGVDVAVAVGDRAVGLAAELILIDPEGIQRLGIEGLHAAVGQADKDHAVCIGGRVDGKGGAANHLARFQNQTGVLIDLHDGLAGVGVEIAAGNDGAAHGAAAVTLAQLVCPCQHGILGSDGRAQVHHAVVVFIRAEQRPVALLKNVIERACGRFGQRHTNGLVLLTGNNGELLAHVAGARHDERVAAAGIQQINSLLIRQDAGPVCVGHEEHRGIARLCDDTRFYGRLLVDLDGIGSGDAADLRVGNGNCDFFRRAGGRVQRNNDGSVHIGLVFGVVFQRLAPVTAGDLHGHVRIDTVGAQRLQRQAQLWGALANAGGVVIHQLVKALLVGFLLRQSHADVVFILDRQACEGHGTHDIDEVVLIQRRAVDRLGLGDLQASLVAVAAHGQEAVNRSISRVRARQ